MNADVLTTRVVDGIAVITLGNARRIYFDAEMASAMPPRRLSRRDWRSNGISS